MMCPIVFINHVYENITTFDKFYALLCSFDKNPFRVNEDGTFRQQMITNLIIYINDHPNLLVAAEQIKSGIPVEQVIENYFGNINAFEEMDFPVPCF